MRTPPAVRVLAAAASVALTAGVAAGAVGQTSATAAAAPAATAPAASAATAPVAKAAAARRAPTGAIISGVPVSNESTPPGSGKTAGYECTAGLPAKKGENYYIVVAGHCGERGETIYTAWTNGKRSRIGVITGVSATYDIAAVRTTRAVAESVWATRSGRDKVIRLRGVADAVPGQKVCQHGYRSGTVCGITTQPITSKQRAAGLVYGRAAAGTVGSRPGDSGGLVLDAGGRAIGIVSESTNDGKWVAWVPTTLALKNWGLREL